MPDCIIENLQDGKVLMIGLNGKHPQFVLRSEAISGAALADLEPELEDLLDIAATVFYADGKIRRGGSTRSDMGAGWHRSLRLTIPVRSPRLWTRSDVGEALMSAVNYLTGDKFEFNFVTAPADERVRTFLDLDQQGEPFEADNVILFSGGLDSFSGALETLSTERGQVILVSHQSAPKVSERQDSLAAYLHERFGNRVRHIKIKAHRVGEESVDTTQRSRSFLFAAIGAAVAFSFRAKRISFFENGIVSHNLPFSPQVVGTMATRTTHPLVLARLSELLHLIMPNVPHITNQYQWMTKSEVVRRISQYGGEQKISTAVSCTRVREQTRMHTHCGTCSQCQDRRFAILAEGLTQFDPSESYATDVLTGIRKEGPARTMGVEWIRHSLGLQKMTEISFFARYGTEISSLIDGYPSQSVDDSFRRIFDLHRRQSQAVVKVLTDAIRLHAEDLVKRNLPPSSLLMMHMAEEPAFAAADSGDGKALSSEPVDPPESWESLGSDLHPTLEFEIVRGRPAVSIRGVCDLSGRSAEVTHLLKIPFEQDQTLSTEPDKHRFVHVAHLPGSPFSKDNARAALSRCRKEVSDAFLLIHKRNAPDGYLIQTNRTHGHRLNPRSRIVLDQ